MEIYRIEKQNMMGFPIEEKFFSSLDKALKEFKKTLRSYRKNGLAKEEDCAHLSKPIVRNKDLIGSNLIAEYMIEVWYKCSYEYDEWDTTVEHLILEKVDVA